ncbi:MAG: hypothetical protein IJO03_10515 [Clostridia bacterium]|nr:hypothetical protein [Clostridia bacterium]MBQ7122681.1 hypothetical protein [Clostridia bacterium]
MKEYSVNNNRRGSNHGKKNALIAVVSSLAAVMIILVAFFLSKNTVFHELARSSAEKGDFSTAAVLVRQSGSEKSQVLEDYINLRLEINEHYPVMLSEYDRDKLEMWALTAEMLCNHGEALGDTMAQEVLELSHLLSQIVAAEKEYNALKADILDMMDVFNEINRLHTKDAEGKNASFTIAAERERIAAWTELNNKILSFISSVPGNENIYLFNYMAKEAQGEISELNAAVDSVADSGYGEEDLVRFRGEAVKRFPDITNSSGESVNLLNKEVYERFMYEEFCNKLVQNLAPYYVS